jgi:nicotinamide riboside transporter PnuC
MNNIEMFIWFNTFIAIIGTIMNAKQIRSGFIIWMITNAVFAVYNVYIGAYAQTALFSVYFGLAVYGWINWGKQPAEKKETAQ